jgi:hypothetical protein
MGKEESELILDAFLTVRMLSYHPCPEVMPATPPGQRAFKTPIEQYIQCGDIVNSPKNNDRSFDCVRRSESAQVYSNAQSFFRGARDRLNAPSLIPPFSDGA